MSHIFFDGWYSLARTAIIGVLAYGSLLAVLRFSGKRTLAKMNAFDLVVTVSLGSTLATVLLSKDVALAQGVLALVLLVVLQFVITWTSVRSGWVRRAVTGEPSLLFYRGEYLPTALRTTRVTEDEVRAAIRKAGLPAVRSVEAVVLETDGSMSVVPRGDEQASALSGLDLPQP